MDTKKPKNIDAYIARFPQDVRKILKILRATIKKAAPRAEETISYQMPTFKLHGKYLVYFAAWKNHIAIYPLPSATKAFKKELALYKGGKGTIKFPIEKPLPLTLIRKIVRFRAKENFAKKEK